jgi:hypothetical protein
MYIHTNVGFWLAVINIPNVLNQRNKELVAAARVGGISFDNDLKAIMQLLFYGGFFSTTGCSTEQYQFNVQELPKCYSLQGDIGGKLSKCKRKVPEQSIKMYYCKLGSKSLEPPCL